jgi:hypothetical protein
VRADLAALDVAALTALSNAGFAKKAARDLAAGDAPALVEAADGTVTGTFADGAVATLPPGRALRDAPCTCGAVGHCRHKVTAALAYGPWAAGRGPAAPALLEGSGAGPALDDAALAAALGQRTVEQARRLVRGGLLVTVSPGPPPTARLPTCTVRFLAGDALAHARCDCAAGHGCAHVVAAVWAFRRAPQGGTVELRPAGRAGDAGALDDALTLVEEVLVGGVATTLPAVTGRFERVAEALAAGGCTWPATLVQDLGAQVEAWHGRSARYSAEAAARLCVELELRRRAAARGDAALPPAYVLGRGEALVTSLDKLRLVSLGARSTPDGGEHRVRVLLADPDTGSVLVWERAWAAAEGGAPPVGAALGRRRVAPGVTVAQLARGRVVTHAARRHANGLVTFGAGALGAAALGDDWSSLPPALAPPAVDALRVAWQARPPRALRPRHLAEDVYVLPVGAVEGVSWDPGAQRLAARLVDPAGTSFEVARGWRAAAPDAIGALAAALGGAHGPVRRVAGAVRWRHGRFEVEPTAVLADTLVVPDLDEAPAGSPPPVGRERRPAEPVEAALAGAQAALDEVAHAGLRGVGAGWPDRGRRGGGDRRRARPAAGGGPPARPRRARAGGAGGGGVVGVGVARGRGLGGTREGVELT